MPKLAARISTDHVDFLSYECMLTFGHGIYSGNAGSSIIAGGVGNVHLTPKQARKFASKMIDMADNIEEKNKCQQS